MIATRDLDLSAPLAVRTIGFNVPCREFVIGAQVSRDKRMPMVDEFVLKVIHHCERITPKRLGAFFGFTPSEIDIVVADLQARSLVRAEGQDLILHPSAVDLFKRSPDGNPTLIDVESYVSRVWFDLISHGIVRWQGMHNVRNLVELRSPIVSKDVALEFAREAFQVNFRSYLRTFRNITNADQWHLYAITEIDAGRFSFAQIEGTEYLTLDPIPRLTGIVDEGGAAHDDVVLRPLRDAMALAFGELSEPDPSLSSRQDFSQLTGFKAFDSVSSDVASLDLRRWLSCYEGANDVEAHPTVGPMYLQRNRSILLRMMQRAVTTADVREIIVVRPGGTAWGRTQELQSMMSDLRDKLREKGAKKILTTIVFSSNTTFDTAKRFEKLFDRGLVSSSGVVSPALEAIVVPGALACVGLYTGLNAKVRLWLGQASSRKRDVDAAAERWSSTTMASFTEVWNRTKASAIAESGAADMPVDPL